MSKSKGDHAIAAIKASAAAVPVIGGTIASLIDDYIPTEKHRFIQSMVGLLNTRLKELEARIDPAAVNTGKFTSFVEKCYLSIVQAQDDDKLAATVTLMSNILLKHDDSEKLRYTELDHFARCLANLSIGALNILGHVVAIAELQERRRCASQSVRLSFVDVHRRLGDMSPDLLMGLLEELNSYHLVHFPGAPSVRLKDYANYPVELPLMGTRFVEHVLKLNT